MKITVTESTEKEVEVSLPAYRKSICHFYRVLSEDDCIIITDLGGHYGINQTQSSTAFRDTNVESSEAEFNEAFDRVLKLLKK